MTDQSQSRPVRILFAVTAGAAVLAGGLPQLTPEKYDWIGAAIGLGGLAIAAGVTRWTENRVTPTENVAARILPPTTPGAPPLIVAGEGSAIKTGEPVDVTVAAPTNWVP
jgi:hypothetical protein